MADSPMRNHPLGLAARYNDAECEEHGLAEVFAKHGLDIKDVVYLATQRAMRAALAAQGPERYAEFQAVYATNQPTPFPMTPAEAALAAALLPSYLDGIFIGWRGARIEGENNG